jgi:DNA polymerase-3 subunit gamma/tau
MNDAPDRSEEPGLGLGPGAPQGAYRVLARKYRPATFEDLIGQDAMVRTLTNAFEAGRIPQAWILTGVRGVGTTTTARILARALNYQTADSSGAPTIHMPGLGVHCQAIMDSRHLDVIEMDAASHNSVDDVRQINDAIRYAPVSARYKVYILDEVHMLSGAAFNALLKTLEEPPPHAKFIFATTDIRKVPVTVLSRCQRFDLRRVEASVLVKHLEGIAAKEKITAEPEALGLIARAAEGSVRDSLSLLDQAIAHAGASSSPAGRAKAGKARASAGAVVRAEDVRQMLGLADRTRVVDLFEALMRGDIAAALTELRDQYDSGADPAVTLTDLAEFTHFVTRVKVVPAVADDVSLTEAERTRGRDFAAKLSMRILARTWQMLLKGIPEVKEAARPVAAAEMVLVRIGYAADLPTPDDVIRSLDAAGHSSAQPSGSGGRSGGEGTSAARYDAPRMAAQGQAAAQAAPRRDPVARQADPAQAQPSRVVAQFTELVALAAEKRDLTVKTALERDVRLVRMEDGRLEIALEQGASRAIVQDLSRKLSDWTGKRWMVIVSAEPGAPTLRSQAEARQEELEIGVRGDPLVQAVLNRFPGAQIVGVRGPATNAVSGDAEPLAEPIEDNDDNQ